MALQITRVDVWAAGIKDRPGGLAEKLVPLSEAGANLGFVIARRAPDRPGTGVVFVTPLKGPRQLRAGKKAGFVKTKSLKSLRVEGPDKAGLGARMTGALAEAGINMRGLSAASIGRRCVVYLAFDTAATAAKAVRILKKM